MKPHLKKHLLQKGWSEAEILHAEEVLDQKTHVQLHFSRIVFWSAVVVIIFANLLVSLVLIPFLIVLHTYVLFSLVIVLAGTIGFLYNFLITDIGHLERKHHILASIIIPLIAIANMAVMVFVSNSFIQELQVQNALHNPVLIGVAFAIALILPYVFDRVRSNFRQRKAVIIS